ncbi:hypothetical protein L2Y96_10535 [Luteibacter aegosomaticola]|uniref:hypothetical protein n=1 Tax=Luteibacter aegosomaticola TaxID=2911538 RepID=UPI001FF73101|nr:hypothetical protein [Luteibacter aegosomaticola]UPG92176.1 hypothetical protein L2Y96_10535 [Luteibacter aegosomaticola]
MNASDELNVRHYAHTNDVHRRCLFTGVHVPGTKRGEHVIPRWLVKDYALHNSDVQVGEPEALARIHEFTAPADAEANGAFGKLEQRIKENRADVSDDELYLWLLKLSSGMLWNHRRLAGNPLHPSAPDQFDVRLEGIVSNEFRDAYASWKNGTFSRKGSFAKLPSRIDRVMILHIFGATILDIGHDTKEGLFPYALMAIGRPGYPLWVASFFDDERKWEDQTVHCKWANSQAATTSEPLFIRASLASALYTMELEPMMHTEEQAQRVLDSVAYAAGVRFFTDDEGVKTFGPR